MFKKVSGMQLIPATVIAVAVVGGFVFAVVFGLSLYADWKGSPF